MFTNFRFITADDMNQVGFSEKESEKLIIFCQVRRLTDDPDESSLQNLKILDDRHGIFKF